MTLLWGSSILHSPYQKKIVGKMWRKFLPTKCFCWIKFLPPKSFAENLWGLNFAASFPKVCWYEIIHLVKRDKFLFSDEYFLRRKILADQNFYGQIFYPYGTKIVEKLAHLKTNIQEVMQMSSLTFYKHPRFFHDIVATFKKFPWPQIDQKYRESFGIFLSPYGRNFKFRKVFHIT